MVGPRREASSSWISTVSRSGVGLTVASLLTRAEEESSLNSQLEEDLLPGSWRRPTEGHRTGSPG